VRDRKTIKCGEFLYKDGVVIKRPGKKFRLPRIPGYLKIAIPKKYSCSATFLWGELDYEEGCDVIREENKKREYAWQYNIEALHHELREMYYTRQIKKSVGRVIKKITTHVGRVIDDIVKEYE